MSVCISKNRESSRNNDSLPQSGEDGGAGLVAKYNVNGTSSACFEYLGAEEHCHKTSCFHCKCEKCGKLIHLHCEDVVKLEQHLMESHGFQMDPCRTVFYGICEDCDGNTESSYISKENKQIIIDRRKGSRTNEKMDYELVGDPAGSLKYQHSSGRSAYSGS